MSKINMSTKEFEKDYYNQLIVIIRWLVIVLFFSHEFQTWFDDGLSFLWEFKKRTGWWFLPKNTFEQFVCLVALFCAYMMDWVCWDSVIDWLCEGYDRIFSFIWQSFRSVCL